MAPEALLSVVQVARRLGCSVSLVQKWRRLGWLSAIRLGTADVVVYGYRPEDIDRFAAERWNRRRGRPPGARSKGVGGPPAAAGAHVAPAAPIAPTAPPAPAQPPADGAARDPAPAAPPLSTSGLPPVAPPASARLASATQPSSTDETRSPGTAATPAAGHDRLTVGPLAGAPAVAPPAPTGRPLVLWAADPRQGTALVLARFRAEELEPATGVAAAWARRYDELALGEAPSAGEAPNVLALWRHGARAPLG